jgi:hypothetical protein
MVADFSGVLFVDRMFPFLFPVSFEDHWRFCQCFLQYAAFLGIGATELFHAVSHSGLAVLLIYGDGIQQVAE